MYLFEGLFRMHCESLDLGRDELREHPMFQWKLQAPFNRRADSHTDMHIPSRCVCVLGCVEVWLTVTNTQQGSPRTRRVNWDRLCLSSQTKTCLFSLSSQSLVHFYLLSPLLLSFLPRHTSSPGWPSVTSTQCPAWPSPSGWPWCLEHRRRTSSVVNSWGNSLCWWSRPPRTSWVSSCSYTTFPFSF